jgi:hypothetical protein
VSKLMSRQRPDQASTFPARRCPNRQGQVHGGTGGSTHQAVGLCAQSSFVQRPGTRVLRKGSRMVAGHYQCFVRSRRLAREEFGWRSRHQSTSLVSPPPSILRHRPRVPRKLGPMAPTRGVPTWQHLRVGQQTQGVPGQTGKGDSELARVRRFDREEAMRIETPPCVVAGPPIAAASTSRSVG